MKQTLQLIGLGLAVALLSFAIWIGIPSKTHITWTPAIDEITYVSVEGSIQHARGLAGEWTKLCEMERDDADYACDIEVPAGATLTFNIRAMVTDPGLRNGFSVANANDSNGKIVVRKGRKSIQTHFMLNDSGGWYAVTDPLP